MERGTIRPADVAILVATFRRNALLAQLLDSLEAHAAGTTVILVDNDPDGAARPAVEGRDGSRIRLTYLHEPRPGIAAARNAALEAIPPGTRAVVFVDDDETVREGWLAALLGYANRTGCDVVTGPVVSRLPDDAPGWIAKGGFFEEGRHPDGPFRHIPATNNTLVLAHWFTGARHLRFDETFSMTGGSDTDLFTRIREQGGTLHWCAAVVVEEDVPASRTTARWVWKRGVRYGNVLGRLALRRHGRAGVAARGVARIGYGTVRIAGRALRLSPLQYADAIYVMRGVGYLGACFGVLHQEYARVETRGALAG